ncbi:MAG: ribonuclease III [Lachnospiraceae bacterium]|nr:ribonuclease III [Lachnospiraceae bacterium]
MTPLEETISYQFKDPVLLKNALTHSSYVHEHGLRKQECNERLEFYGDAILEQISSRYLFAQYPDLMEGELSRRRAALVCERSLAEAARAIGLGKALYLGRGMALSGGRDSDSILSDAFEALLAALTLDGAEEVAKRLVDRYVLNETVQFEEADPKTALQELLQAKNLEAQYVQTGESGPDHDKTFEFEVRIAGKPYARASGHSKKTAQMQAALETIRMIKGQSCI